MQKREIFRFSLALGFVLLCSLLIATASAVGTVEDELKRVTFYAQEYETGNINYVQLMVYISASKQRMNELLGATNKEMGGTLTDSQLREILGEPTETTSWVWVENEEKEKNMKKNIPAWRKIIFDGNKIQMRINSWPSLFQKEGQESLIYRLNFEVTFKKEGDKLDLASRIAGIKNLADIFNKNPTAENAENLAKESVNAEMLFNQYYQQNHGECIDIMIGIFGSENQKEPQKTIVQEITILSGDNFEAIARLELCDDCQWNWIGLNFNLEGRGPGFRMPKQQSNSFSQQDFKDLSEESFKTEIKSTLEQIKQALEQKDYNQFFSLSSKMQALNWAWNEKSNNIWPEIDKKFRERQEAISQEERKNFDWRTEEKERKELEKSMMKANYDKRKTFFTELFSGYEKKEFFYSQIEFEKRLVEEFKERGEEICNNVIDDNNNGNIDCSDNLCSGKICGSGKRTIVSSIASGTGNETIGGTTTKETQDMYCIRGTCQFREEIVKEINLSICGNHVCESGEMESCKEDCSICQVYPPLECSGRVIFSGNDENGCPLEPVCLNELDSCTLETDCVPPLCGKAECVEGKCQTTTLEECREAECHDGENKVVKCETGEQITTDTCVEGIWRQTNVQCSTESGETGEETIETGTPVVGTQCTVREDCGGADDVCSNGVCVTIPRVVETPQTETQQEQQQTSEGDQQEEEEQQETQQEQTSQSEPVVPITGGVIKFFSRVSEITGNIVGFVITGFEGETGESGTQENVQTPTPTIETQPAGEQQQPQDQEQRNQPATGEQGQNLRPGEGREQMPDGEQNQQGQQNYQEQPMPREDIRDDNQNNNQINNNPDDQNNNQMENMQQEQKEMPKEEKGVFKVGGMCRTSQQKKEVSIYFDGWGDPFQQIQPLKQKYYTGGQGDWCKENFENLKIQRAELEKGLNQEFATWFFEKYLANGAEDWEQYVSGIFELYWKDVDISREMGMMMQCLEIDSLPAYNLISFKYESEYGSVEFWEEVQTVKLPGAEKEAQVISPYMKVWVFPPKAFIQSEMKKAMKNHEFPGPPEDKAERKREEGMTAEEKEMLKQNSGFMDKIKTISEKYNGNLNIAVQFKDFATEEIVFNLYVQVNENDILKIEPMLPEEAPATDATIEIDFERIYEMIYASEKDMRGARLESPPWDRKMQPIAKVKEMVNGVKMYFKLKGLMNSAKISPEDSASDIKFLLKTFMSMKKSGDREGQSEDSQDQEENSDQTSNNQEN